MQIIDGPEVMCYLLLYVIGTPVIDTVGTLLINMKYLNRK